LKKDVRPRHEDFCPVHPCESRTIGTGLVAEAVPGRQTLRSIWVPSKLVTKRLVISGGGGGWDPVVSSAARAGPEITAIANVNAAIRV
jgi:hypothetical protein